MRSILLSLGVLCVSSLPVLAQTASKPATSNPKQVAEEVIAVTKAQWAAENKKDVAASMKNIADDYTVFDGAYPTRLDGKGLNQRLAEASAGGSDTNVTSEMANEKVQVYGDVAILSYNYVGATKNKDGKVSPQLAKSTRVYVKQGGQWMLVHANFAPVTVPNSD
jgi:ketosteroid isomerase-like protein